MKFLQLFRLHNPIFFNRVGALLVVFIYVSVLLLAYRATVGSSSLSFRASVREGERVRVSWVMPGGYGWDQGVRPGMEVLSVDGIPVSTLEIGVASVQPKELAQLVASTGESLQVEAAQTPIGESPMKYSLWSAGGMFALLGAAVLLRRPDYHAARMFALASTLVAVALAVAPGAGGPAPPWAVAIQFLSMIGIGATWFPLGFALWEESSGPHRSIRFLMISIILGLVIAIVYGIAVLIKPYLYNVIRPMLILYFSLSLLGLVGSLALRGVRKDSRIISEQARICLWGAALGGLPFVCLTLIPEVILHEAIVPGYISILALIFTPAFFAYAILQHQLMGIRRLVHRGMVYGITTFILFVAVNLIVMVTISAFTDIDADNNLFYLLIPVILVAGIVLFSPLKRAIRLLLDKYFYQDMVDYRSAFRIVPEHLLITGSTAELATAISRRLVQVLSLESVLLFLGHSPAEVKLAAKVGEKTGEIYSRFKDQIEHHLHIAGSHDIVELRLESDSLLCVPLTSSGHYLGCMILGPKKAGEVFMEEEKKLLGTLVPIISLVFDKAELSDELRGLSQRLIKAEEKERARIAGDLHDGPLQKAAFLVSAIGTDLEDQRSYANQLVAELREICSSLRPAILSDLGLVPALEWLLDNNARRHEISPHLLLHNVEEEDRFPPEIEDTLFRIAQEAINNTIKHSHATSIELSLSREDGNVLLHVTDNGAGFQTTSRDRGKYGLPGMRERAIQIGGSFDVHSAVGLGTTVVVSIPVELYTNHHEGDINEFIN